MEITFNNLRSKDVVNLYDGKRLGRIIDVSFSKETGRVLGFIIPGVKKAFRKIDDIFIPLELINPTWKDIIEVINA